MNEEYILSIDQGTTGTTALLIEHKSLQIFAKSNTEFPQIYPQPGLVEHDLNDIWKSVEKSISDVLSKSKISPNKIIAIGICNQRETVCAFNKSGNPYHNAIVWQDRRTADFCNQNKTAFEKSFLKNTGLPLDPYFSATKMKWLIENIPEIDKANSSNELLFGTIDTYLLYKLTSNSSYYTDSTNASRTLLYDLKQNNWSDQLLSYFNISKTSLPEIKDSFGLFGKTKDLSFLPNDIPIYSILGDQQSALFGQQCTNIGDIKVTYGTGSFALVNTGEKLLFSKNGLLSTVAYSHKGQNIYALEGAVYIAGAAVQWLRDNLNIIQSAPEIEKLAESAFSDLNALKNILFFPFFTGIASPYWNSEAKAAIIGLTRDSSKAHIAFACLEGIALSLVDLISTLSQDANSSIGEIRVDGGACSNDLLMRIQATALNQEIQRPKNIETTAFGVALGCLIGMESHDISSLSKMWEREKSFHPEDNYLSYFKDKKVLWDNYIKKLYC